MLSTASFEQVYSGMIAGRVPNHDGDVSLSIFFMARDILGTDNLHLLTAESPDAKFVYYFAQQSSVFASQPLFETSLAAAFPGNPDHMGDGAYLLTHGSISTAVIKDGDQFRLITNSTDVVKSAISDMDLTIYPAEHFTPVQIQSITGNQRYLADIFSGKVIKWSAIVSASALVLGLLANIASTAFSTSLKNTNDKKMAELSLLVSKIEHASPLSQQLASFQKISATVVRAGGWIDHYELIGGKEKFSVSLPDWVTQDFIIALGKDAVADRDPINNLIKVHK